MAEDPTAINGISILLFIGLAFAPLLPKPEDQSCPSHPLHFGVLAPIKHFPNYRISVWSFGLVNLWIDLPIIEAVLNCTRLGYWDWVISCQDRDADDT
jgi:hypothetical protein